MIGTTDIVIKLMQIHIILISNEIAKINSIDYCSVMLMKFCIASKVHAHFRGMVLIPFNTTIIYVFWKQKPEDLRGWTLSRESPKETTP